MTKKYCYNNHCHVFNEKGEYLGFQLLGESIAPNHSPMTTRWVEENKKLEDLISFLKEAGFEEKFLPH